MKQIIIIPLFVSLLTGAALADLPEVPDLDDFDAIKERCDKKAGPDVYEKLKTAKEESVNCVKGLIDIEKVKDEVEEAKKTGSMDEVFGRYCNKRPDFKTCIKKTYDAAFPCLEDNEKDAINVTGHIIEQIGDFVCHNDGDRIAMFVAEGGVECIKARTEQIRDCFNATLKINPLKMSSNSMPDLAFDKKKCDNIKEIQECVVKDLEENCEDSTPANFVDAMFRYVKKLACKNIIKRSVNLVRRVRNAMETTRNQLKAELEEKLMKICNRDGDEETYKQFMISVNNARSCLHNYQILKTPLSVHKVVFTNCTKSAREAFEKCLSNEEKYYPNLILQVMQNLLEFIHKNADKLAASPANLEYGQCMKIMNENEPQSQIMACYNKYKEGNVDAIPPKEELCKKIKEFDVCLVEVFKKNCMQDIKIEKVLNNLISALEGPCLSEDVEVTTAIG